MELVFGAIPYITSGFTLIAFISALIFYANKSSLDKEVRIIELTPEADRASVIIALAEKYHIPLPDLPEKDRAHVAIRLIEGRKSKLNLNQLVSIIGFLVGMALVAASIYFEPPPPPPSIALSINEAGAFRFWSEYQNNGVDVPRNERLQSNLGVALSVVVNNLRIPSQSAFIQGMHLSISAGKDNPINCLPKILHGIDLADSQESFWNTQGSFAPYSVADGTSTTKDIGFHCSTVQYDTFLSDLQNDPKGSLILELKASLRDQGEIAYDCVIERSALSESIEESLSTESTIPNNLHFTCKE